MGKPQPYNSGNNLYCFVVGSEQEIVWCNKKTLKQIPWFQKMLERGKLNPTFRNKMPSFVADALETVFEFVSQGKLDELDASTVPSAEPGLVEMRDNKTPLRYITAYSHAYRLDHEGTQNSIVDKFIHYYAAGGFAHRNLVRYLLEPDLRSSKLYEVVMRAAACSIRSGEANGFAQRAHELRLTEALTLEDWGVLDLKKMIGLLDKKGCRKFTDLMYMYLYVRAEPIKAHATNLRAQRGIIKAGISENSQIVLENAVLTTNGMSSVYQECELYVEVPTRKFRIVRGKGDQKQILLKDTPMADIKQITMPNTADFNVICLLVAGSISETFTYDLAFKNHQELLLFGEIVCKLEGTKMWSKESGAKIQAAMKRRVRKSRK